MSARNRQFEWGVMAAVVASIAAHVVFLVTVGPYLRPESDATEPEEASKRASPEDPEPMKVTVVPEEEPPEPEPTEPEQSSEHAPDRPKEPKERDREKKREKEERDEKKPPTARQYNRKSVVQQTNEESPEEAQFVSEQANKVEKQTRARETVQEFAKPSKEAAERKKRESERDEESSEEKLGSRAAVASKARRRSRPPPKPSKPQKRRRERNEQKRKPKPREGKGPQPTPQQEEAPRQQRQEARPKQLPMPTVSDYSKVFDEKADRRRREQRREKGVGDDMFRRIEESKGSVKATLENYIPEVQPGNHTSVNAHANAAATYVNRIHSKIHPRWGGTYLPHLDTSYGPSHPLSNPHLNAVLEFVIDGRTGQLEEVTIVSSSGVTSYDMEAVTIAKSVAPHTTPPSEIVSPDGNVYMHWNFWRDQRQCGTFGVDVYKVDRERGGGASGGGEGDGG